MANPFPVEMSGPLSPAEEAILRLLMQGNQPGQYSQQLQQALMEQLQTSPPDMSGAQNADTLLNIARSIAEPVTSFQMGQGPAGFAPVFPAQESVLRNQAMQQQASSQRLSILGKLAQMEQSGQGNSQEAMKMLFYLMKDYDAQMRGFTHSEQMQQSEHAHQDSRDNLKYARDLQQRIDEALMKGDQQQYEALQALQQKQAERLMGRVPESDPRLQPVQPPNYARHISPLLGAIREDPSISITPENSQPMLMRQQRQQPQGMPQGMSQGGVTPEQAQLGLGPQDNLGVYPIPPPQGGGPSQQMQQPMQPEMGGGPPLQSPHEPAPVRTDIPLPPVESSYMKDYTDRMKAVKALGENLSQLTAIISRNARPYDPNSGGVPGGGKGLAVGETAASLLSPLGVVAGAIEGGIPGAIAGGATGKAFVEPVKKWVKGMVSKEGQDVQRIMDAILGNIVSAKGVRLADSDKEKDILKSQYGLDYWDPQYDSRIVRALPQLLSETKDSLTALKSESPELYEYLRSKGFHGEEELDYSLHKAQVPDTMVQDFIQWQQQKANNPENAYGAGYDPFALENMPILNQFMGQ